MVAKKAYECYFPLHEVNIDEQTVSMAKKLLFSFEQSLRSDVTHVDDNELNDREVCVLLFENE